jgi:hypothetical protein
VVRAEDSVADAGPSSVLSPQSFPTAEECMPVLPTIDIVSPKDGVSLWRINEADYNPGKHVLWAERPQQDPEPESLPAANKPPAAKKPALDAKRNA